MTRTRRTRRTLTGRRLTAVCAGITAAAIAIPAVAFELANPTPTPVDRVAFVARNDNPFDALALGPVAGALGGIVVITDSAGLSQDAADGLTDFAPDRIFMAGGEVALSSQVESDLEALGSWDVDRIAGENRNETARLLGGVLDTLGVGRPVLTGATVDGNAYVTGEIAGRVEPHTTTTAPSTADSNTPKLVATVTSIADLPEVPADGQVQLTGMVRIGNEYGSSINYAVAISGTNVAILTVASGEFATVTVIGYDEVEAGDAPSYGMTITPLNGPAATPLPYSWGGATIRAEYLPASRVTAQG